MQIFGQSEENEIVSMFYNIVYIFATLFILAVNCFVAEKLRVEVYVLCLY